jgi:phytoene dehydrogenase-like protein
METKDKDRSIIIIGAGFAGLAAGIYAQMNGYRSQIFELHDKPGGLCTSWERKGYTIDGCIHWLVGSNPESRMHDFWQEVGVTQGRKFINMEEYTHFEDSAGRKLVLYSDVDRLEREMLSFSPADAPVIRDFIDGIRMCLSFDQPSITTPVLKRLGKQARMIAGFILNGKKMQRWMKTSCGEFAARFSDPLLKKAFGEMWGENFSMLFMLFTFAYLHNRNAGYPIGGSLPMSKALESRYLALEGTIHYNKTVSRIITDGGKAVGIILEDGTEYRCSRVISAADGYSTIFKMLESKYINDSIRNMYDTWPLFPSLIFAGIGVNRRFDDINVSVSGFNYALREPVEIADKTIDSMFVHIFHHDNTMAPEGKTALIIMLYTGYDYWKKLRSDRNAYLAKKEEVGRKLISLLEQRFPGISSQVEMIDIATPVTFERYTGNWKGTFEGWQITPQNAGAVMKPLSQTLPGLSNFYMCGQWVEPGGGLPTGIMSARRLFKGICKEDGKKFTTTFA